jgi:hypothetical protein
MNFESLAQKKFLWLLSGKLLLRTFLSDTLQRDVGVSLEEISRIDEVLQERVLC